MCLPRTLVWGIGDLLSPDQATQQQALASMTTVSVDPKHCVEITAEPMVAAVIIGVFWPQAQQGTDIMLLGWFR